MPEGQGVHRLVEAENFFHATIAVRGNDQVLARQTWLGVRDTHENVVMKLALLMMHDQVIASPIAAYTFEE